MRLNRRQFLQGLAAGAVVAALPPESAVGELTKAEATLDGIAGVDSYGNGWYRCWLTFEDQVFSTFTKQKDTCNTVRLQLKDAYAVFDLTDGTVKKASHDAGIDKRADLYMPEHDVGLAGTADFWGVQLECTSPSITYVPTARPTKNYLLSEQPRTNKIAQSVALACAGSPLVP